MNETFESSQQGLACESGTGYCPGTTVCAYDLGLCRAPCINGTCQNSSQTCCTQPYGSPYCSSFCG